MDNTITKEQLAEIEDVLSRSDRETAYGLLEEYTGIKAKPYTAWAFYDDADNWVGDSDHYTINDLLDNAYIKIVEKGGAE